MSEVHSHRVISSGDVVLDRRFAWARESLAAGDFAGAADILEQTLEVVPHYAPAWFALGEAREALAQTDAAIKAYVQALATDPEDLQGATLRLIRLGAQPAGAMPQGYVQTLYDGYAPRFEQSLLEGLGYRAPELLLHAVEEACAREPTYFGRALDLGCGTGLGGAAFRAICGHLTGVDLSPRMIEIARAKKIYARLVDADVVSFAAAEAERGATYDLVLAADVFIYFHDLALLKAIAPLMKPEALLAFSVETHDGDGVILRDTLRYAHGEAHVRDAIDAAGLALVTLEQASTRTEKGVPVSGLVVVAAKP